MIVARFSLFLLPFSPERLKDDHGAMQTREQQMSRNGGRGRGRNGREGGRLGLESVKGKYLENDLLIEFPVLRCVTIFVP